MENLARAMLSISADESMWAKLRNNEELVVCMSSRRNVNKLERAWLRTGGDGLACAKPDVSGREPAQHMPQISVARPLRAKL